MIETHRGPQMALQNSLIIRVGIERTRWECKYQSNNFLSRSEVCNSKWALKLKQTGL